MADQMFETTIISSAQIEVRGRADYFAKAALNALEQALADPILIVKVTDMDGNSRTYEVSKKGPGPVARLVS